jgi:hypothetical protein
MEEDIDDHEYDATTPDQAPLGDDGTRQVPPCLSYPLLFYLGDMNVSNNALKLALYNRRPEPPP